MISRTTESVIRRDFGKGKVLVVLGPRQVGKTTLGNQLVKDGTKVLHLDCDNYDDRDDLQDKTAVELAQLIKGYDLVFIDEAQRVKNIGLTLKMLCDLHAGSTIIATGSSSLELADEINEPATGRLFEYPLYPFSLEEMAAHHGERDERRLLEQRMVYGLYPEVVIHPEDARRLLMTVVNSYLYKDLLSYKGIKKPDLLNKLTTALALQVGSEVSYNELSNMLDVDKETVESYINLLEKSFVVFRLNSYSRNLRNEIKKGRKIYFYDNGVRNAVINNFSPLSMRNDVGALWENLMVAERVKRNTYHQSYAQLFFWRTQQQKEIDLLEIQDGHMSAFEFKWNEGKKTVMPKAFSEAYPGSSFDVVTPSTFWPFVKCELS